MTPLWLVEKPLILASRSKVRQALLEGAGIPLNVCPADIDERRLEAGAASQAPGAVAAYLAREKARAVAKLHSGALTLGADQTLALGTARFSKPADIESAREQLRMLSGKPTSSTRPSPSFAMTQYSSNMLVWRGSPCAPFRMNFLRLI